MAQNSPLQATYFLAVGSNKVMRCSSLLAYMLLHIEVPAVIRLAIKCAKVFFKLVDLRKLKLFYSESDEKTPLQLKGILDSNLPTDQSDFLTEAFKTIGAKITNSRNISEPVENTLDAKPSVEYSPAETLIPKYSEVLRE